MVPPDEWNSEFTEAECQRNLLNLTEVLQNVQETSNKNAAKPSGLPFKAPGPSAVKPSAVPPSDGLPSAGLPSDWKDLTKSNGKKDLPFKAPGPFWSAAPKKTAKKSPAPKSMPQSPFTEPKVVYYGPLVELLKKVRNENLSRGNTARNADAILINEVFGGDLDDGQVENLENLIGMVRRGEPPITECKVIPSQPTEMRANQQAASSNEMSWEGPDSCTKAEAEAWAAEEDAEMQADEEAWAAHKPAENPEWTAEMQAEVKAWAAENSADWTADIQDSATRKKAREHPDWWGRCVAEMDLLQKERIAAAIVESAAQNRAEADCSGEVDWSADVDWSAEVGWWEEEVDWSAEGDWYKAENARSAEASSAEPASEPASAAEPASEPTSAAEVGWSAAGDSEWESAEDDWSAWLAADPEDQAWESAQCPTDQNAQLSEEEKRAKRASHDAHHNSRGEPWRPRPGKTTGRYGARGGKHKGWYTARADAKRWGVLNKFLKENPRPKKD